MIFPILCGRGYGNPKKPPEGLWVAEIAVEDFHLEGC